MNHATVTIPYSEFQAIRDSLRDSEQEIARLKKQIADAQVSASDQTLLAVARAGIEITRYAVASLPAESNKGWPVCDLQMIATRLCLMPDFKPDDRELATTFERFAGEIELYERRRKALAGVPQPESKLVAHSQAAK